MIGAALAGLVAVLTACAPACIPSTGTEPIERPPCPGVVVTVRGDDPIGCDVRPPQRLDMLEVSALECDDRGGSYDLEARTCHGIDY